jgi:hypothetical protein
VPKPAAPDVEGFPQVRGFLVTGTDPCGDDPDRFAAIQEGSRRRVALRVLPPLTEQERTGIVSLLAEYAALENEHLAAPVALAADGDALVVPVAAQATLARVSEPPRTAGQVVTALAPIAVALAAVHRAGLAHGAVGADAVAIDRDGYPTLLAAGVVAALHELAPREVAQPTAAGDVSALLALVRQAAADTDSPELRSAAAALSERSAGAQQVAQALLDVADPEPLGAAPVVEADQGHPGGPPHDSVAAQPGPPSRQGAARTLRRPGLLVAVVVLAAVAAAVVAVFGGRGDTATTLPVSSAATQEATRPSVPAAPPTERAEPTEQATPDADPAQTPAVAVSAGVELCGPPGAAASTTPPTPQDWAVVVRELYTRRSAALLTGQQRRLCDVYDQRSAGLVSDLELDAAYTDQQVRPDALVFVVEDAEVVEQQGGLVVLEITDRLEPYALLGGDGTVVAELPGLPATTWQARLVPDSTGQEWRFG